MEQKDDSEDRACVKNLSFLDYVSGLSVFGLSFFGLVI